MNHGRDTVLIRMILGSPRHLQDRWIQDCQQGILTGPTLVPNETLSQFLHGLLQDKIHPLPPIETLWNFARSRLPLDAKVAPIGMEQALAALLARDFGQELPQKVPGIYLNIIRHALELRRRRVTLPFFDGIPWPRILTWLEDVWPESLYDEFRVYQYAATVSNVIDDTSSSLAIYGYVEAHESQWQLLDKLSHHYSIIVYTPWLNYYENILAEDWIKEWRRRGAVTESLTNDGIELRQSIVRVRPGTLMLHAVIEEIKEHRDQDVLVALAGIDWIPLVRLAQRRGLALAQRRPVLYSAKNLWQAFWRLARGSGDETDRLLWLEAVSERHDTVYALEFLAKWSKKLEQIGHWQDLTELIREAAAFHDRADLTGVLKASLDWSIYDHWHMRPYQGMVEELQNLLPFEAPYDSRGTVSWAQGLNARGLTASVIIVAALSEGRFPRKISSNSLWTPELAQLYRLPAADHAHQQDLHLLHLLRESASQEICWMVSAEDDGVLWYLEDRGEMVYRHGPELLHTKMSGSNRERITKRLRSDYEEDIFDAYQGVIGPELGEKLWPREFTPTQLERFGTCPLAYFYEYILGIVPISDESPGSVKPTVKGQWMHKVLEEAVHLGSDVTAQDMRRLADRVIRLLPPPHPVLEAVMRHQKEDMVRDLLQAWPLIRPQDGVIISTENRVQGEMLTDFGTWLFRGRLDRVDQSEDGVLSIMDYKTGAVKNPNHLTADNMQLALYYEAMKVEFPNQSIMARVQGISAGNQFQTRELNPGDILPGQIPRIVNEMAVRIHHGEFLPLPRVEQDPCRICSFALLCPADIKTIRRRKRASDEDYWGLWEGEQ